MEFDIGKTVICDICDHNFTNSDEEGGILVMSYGVCPRCAKAFEADIIKNGEEWSIKARCPIGVSFRSWSLSLRNGNNTISITEFDF